MYKTEEYKKVQLWFLLQGRDKEYKNYGNVDDLDPDKYDWKEMRYISYGRGNNKNYGNIDDLDPDIYDWVQMDSISKGRGDDKNYGNIDDLKPKEYTGVQMNSISLGRGVKINGIIKEEEKTKNK